jgi:hypothetical protein
LPLNTPRLTQEQARERTGTDKGNPHTHKGKIEKGGSCTILSHYKKKDPAQYFPTIKKNPAKYFPDIKKEGKATKDNRKNRLKLPGVLGALPLN